ncbi:hypothetical protein PMAYCL1PPCAC_25052, partial [Pristionchus mayeri]
PAPTTRPASTQTALATTKSNSGHETTHAAAASGTTIGPSLPSTSSTPESQPTTMTSEAQELSKLASTIAGSRKSTGSPTTMQSASSTIA